MDESKYHVLLLGAGFSAPYGLPVMREFMMFARRRFFSGDFSDDKLRSYYEEMFNFCLKCQRSSQHFNLNWENIEDLYTQADLLRITEKTKDADRLCRSIAWAIWDVYRFLTPKPHHENSPSNQRFKLPLLKVAFNQIKKSQRLHPVIVTTNYDVIAELGAKGRNDNETIDQTWDYFYPGVQLPGDSETCRLDPTVGIKRCEVMSSGANAFPVIKLHGSVNWMSDIRGNATSWSISNSIGYTQGSRTGINENGFDVTGVCEHQSPAIIPPMLGKTSGAELISAQWKAAIEAFRCARRITIVGYSFPTTDSFMPRLLAEGVGFNDDLQEIMIVDQGSIDRWAPIIRRLFTTISREHKVRFLMKNSAYLFDGKEGLFMESPKSGFEGQVVTD